MQKKKVIIIGPAHPLRGGLASFDERLCRAFNAEGYDCSIFSFSLQYPSFIFPGTTQYSSEPAPKDIRIYSVINSIHPLNWWHNGNQLKNLKPDLIVVRFWLPLMGPALGTILRRVRRNNKTRVVAITDNIIPHEKRFGDSPFTRYFLAACDGFITMSEKVMRDLRTFEKDKPAKQVLHPLYDNFGEPISRKEARAQLGIPDNLSVALFFGFIRKYKGLDILLQALKILKDKNFRPSTGEFRLLVAGEYYEDSKYYKELIDELDIKDWLILKTDFIADSEVRNYLCASDLVIQPYRNATQSGVTPLAYHFEKPMIVTNVGSLPDLVKNQQSGLVAEPDPSSIAAAIEKFYQLGEDYFLPHLREEKKKYSWNLLIKAIEQVACESQS